MDDRQRQSIAFRDEEVSELRKRLQKMDDRQLKEFGEAARFMCSPRANFGHPPREVFVTQLREAREEWRRRKQESYLD